MDRGFDLGWFRGLMERGRFPPPFPRPEIPDDSKVILARNCTLARTFRVLGCYSFAYHALREMAQTLHHALTCMWAHSFKHGHRTFLAADMAGFESRANGNAEVSHKAVGLIVA
jgi:hypothetical protein